METDIFKTHIANIIKTKRIDSGMTQEKLADKAGISPRYYQDLEAGHKKPSIETMFKLAKALGYDYSALFSPVWDEWNKHSEKSE